MGRPLLVAVVLCASGARADFGGWYRLASTSDNSASQSSSASTNASGATTNAPTSSTAAGQSTGVAQGPSSTIVAATAGLLLVAGGIVTTVYAVQAQARAKLRAEEFRRLHPVQRSTPPGPPPAPLDSLPPPPASPTEPPLPPAAPAPSGTWQPQTSRVPAEGPSLDAKVQARAWFVANRLQLQQDLALGAGPSLEDLAGIAGIAPGHRAHFGRLLQRERAQLLLPTVPTLSQAADTMGRVGELVFADPVLRHDAEALLASW